MTTKNHSCAILMPVPSLMGGHGIGNYLSCSRAFIDELAAIGVDYWQILPLGKTDQYGCPYASPSAFGLSHLLIDEAALGISAKSDDIAEINYELLGREKMQRLLAYAAKEVHKSENQVKIEEFKSKYFWAHDMAIFLALSLEHGADWTMWPVEFKKIEGAGEYVNRHLLLRYQELLFLEVIAHQQWFETKNYARSKGIEIIGDVPIFVSRYSFDCWRWPEIFKVNPETGEPLVITGAPPDDFSPTGQLWGTLNYRWQERSAEVINWWSARMSYLLEQFDILRIDHFIGLYHVWESPAAAPDASFGKWVPSEGKALLQRLAQDHPHMPFIAEDLGALSPEVTQLRESFGLPSMKVFQFAIGEDDNNPHLPKFQDEMGLIYSATHDNNTLWGWIESERVRDPQFLLHLQSRLGVHNINELSKDELIWLILERLLSSKARTCVFQLQDILGLGSEARINVPGTQQGNWNWKMQKKHWDVEKIKKFKSLIHQCQRQHLGRAQ